MIIKNFECKKVIKTAFLIFILFITQGFHQKCNAKLNINDRFVSFFVFAPKKKIKKTPLNFNLKYEEVWIDLPNKNKLYGWYVLADEKTNKNIIYLHGIKGNVSSYLRNIEQLHKTKANILIVDYEGFGKSTGKALIKNTINDALAMYDYLTSKKGATGDNISLYGFSYGGAVTVELALKRKVHAVVLESTFSSLKKITLFKYSPIASIFVPRSLLDTQKNIKLITIPIIISYAGNDKVVPTINSLDLYKEANKPKYLFEIKEAEHHNIFQFATSEYTELIKKVFI